MEKLFYIAPDASVVSLAQEGVICYSGNSGTESVGFVVGEVLTDSDFEWREDGLLKRKDKNWTEKWNGIEVDYEAGYDADAVPDLAEAVVAIAAGVLSVASGVTSESADGVTISYSSSAASIAASLTSQQRSALEPYKVVGSHAA